MRDNLLLYGGPYYSEAEALVRLMQTNQTNFTSNTKPTAGEGEAIGFSIGAQGYGTEMLFGIDGYWGVEAGFSSVEWRRTLGGSEEIDESDSTVGVIWGLMW